MVEINLGDIEKKMLDGVPIKIFVCILMLLICTLMLFNLGVLAWTIRQLESLDKREIKSTLITSYQ